MFHMPQNNNFLKTFQLIGKHDQLQTAKTEVNRLGLMGCSI